MNKNIFFNSSLPRSGSTLFSNIIGQDTRFFVTPTSGLLELLYTSRAVFSKSPEFQAQNKPEQAQQPAAGVDPNDPTGSGGATIGTGQVPVPGEQGFTGVPQQGGQQQQANTQPTQAVGEQPAPNTVVQ